MPTISAWINDDKSIELDELLERNIKGYTDEFIQDEKRERFKSVFLSNKKSTLVSELLNIGLIVVNNASKEGDGRHKIDMSQYYEELLHHVLFIRSGMESSDGVVDNEQITRKLNVMFRGSVDSYD